MQTTPVMRVMVNGLPGNMATLIANRLLNEGHAVIPIALTGPEINQYTVEIQRATISLLSCAHHHNFAAIKHEHWPFVVVDFTCPGASESNAKLYCEYGVPFVMGTTGGDASIIRKTVEESGNIAVLAPNMATPIVIIQAMLEWAAKTFPNALKEYELEIVESHQQGKTDTSGTAKAVAGYINQLGCVPFANDQIVMVRDPETQIQMGVPKDYLHGHAHHHYTLKSPDGTVALAFIHNVNGRNVYVDGVIRALEFIEKQINASNRGLFSMIDVLSAK